MQKTTKKITFSALFIALGFLLPFITGQIPQIGNLLLPMHIPVFLCGLLCGWQYGAIVGFLLPLFRSWIFGMPPIYPVALAMALELMTYGFVVGLLYEKSKQKNIVAIYRSLILAMILGRVVWGIAEIILLGAVGNHFTWQLFMAGAFFHAIPGIVLQLVLIPGIVTAVQRTGVMQMEERSTTISAR